MPSPSALTNRDPHQRKKQSQSGKGAGQRLSGAFCGSRWSTGSYTVLSVLRPRVSGKHKDSETRLHLSHLGGAGVFIRVIFPFPSASELGAVSRVREGPSLLPPGSRTLSKTQREAYSSSQICSLPNPAFRDLIHFELVIILRRKV